MSDLYLGLMSGTSMDAIDAALVDLSDDLPHVRATRCAALPDNLIARVRALAWGTDAQELEALGRLDVELGQRFAAAALALLEHADVDARHVAAIASHGQTVRHRPDATPPFTVQIADPNVIAQQTGITTIADFRRRDIAAGGQGAPLAPAFHASVLRSDDEDRGVLNLGGIANLTVLPRDRDAPVSGFDTGPANTLLDGWARQHGRGAYDRDGAWAASGEADTELLEALLDDEYFRQPPPKSTGPELFDRGWLERRLHARHTAPADVQATLCELTAVSVTQALTEHLSPGARVLICGGGAYNQHLMKRLARRLDGYTVETTAAHGLAPEWVEAVAFAWLGRETLAGRPGNLPSVTGARRAVVLGGIYKA